MPMANDTPTEHSALKVLLKTTVLYVAYYAFIILFLLVSGLIQPPVSEFIYSLQSFYQDHLTWLSWMIIGIVLIETLYLLYVTYKNSKSKKYLLTSLLFLFVILPAFFCFETFIRFDPSF